VENLQRQTTMFGNHETGYLEDYRCDIKHKWKWPALFLSCSHKNRLHVAKIKRSAGEIYIPQYVKNGPMIVDKFDVNRPICHKSMREKFFILVPSDLDQWPFTSNLFSQFFMSRIMSQENLKFLQLSMNRTYGSFYRFPISRKSEIRNGRTDWLTDIRTWCNT